MQYGGVALHLCTVQGETLLHLHTSGEGEKFCCDLYAADTQKTGESPPGTSHGIYLILSSPLSRTQGIKRVGYKIKLDVSQ